MTLETMLRLAEAAWDKFCRHHDKSAPLVQRVLELCHDAGILEEQGIEPSEEMRDEFRTAAGRFTSAVEVGEALRETARQRTEDVLARWSELEPRVTAQLAAESVFEAAQQHAERAGLVEAVAALRAQERAGQTPEAPLPGDPPEALPFQGHTTDPCAD